MTAALAGIFLICLELALITNSAINEAENLDRRQR